MGVLEPQFLLWRCLKGNKYPHSPRKHTALLLHGCHRASRSIWRPTQWKGESQTEVKAPTSGRVVQMQSGDDCPELASHCTRLLAFAQEGLVYFFCKNMSENNFVVFGPEFIDLLTWKSPSSAAKVPLERQRMLCPFNREEMAPPKDLVTQLSCARGCLMLHNMLHRGFSPWRFFPSLHLPAFAGAAEGKMLARAQHRRRMEPTRDFALKWGCVRKGNLFPLLSVPTCSVSADAPRGRLAAERRALRFDPPAEHLWVKRFTRPKSSDIFLGGG